MTTLFLPLYPGPPNPTFSRHRRPTFHSLVQSSESGREVTDYQNPNPMWEFELTYEILKEQSQNQSKFPDVVPSIDLQLVSALFAWMNGQYGSFIFEDPSDFSRTGQVIGTGDGSTDAFVFQRTYGYGGLQITEPVGIVDVRFGATLNIYLNGTPLAQAGNWWIDTDLRTLRFVSPPGSGVSITADFGFFYFCRFIDESLELEAFLEGRWSIKKVRFRSTIPDPPISDKGIGYQIDNQDSTILTPQGATKVYFEIKVNNATTDCNTLLGLCNGSFNLKPSLDLNLVPGVYSVFNGGTFWKHGEHSFGTGAFQNAWSGNPGGTPQAQNNLGPGTSLINHVIGFALDPGNRLVWMRDVTVDSTRWYGLGIGTPDPVIGANGYPLGDCGIGPIDPIYILGGVFQEGTSNLAGGTLNTLGPFAASAPTGFSAWGTEGWDTTTGLGVVELDFTVDGLTYIAKSFSDSTASYFARTSGHK